MDKNKTKYTDSVFLDNREIAGMTIASEASETQDGKVFKTYRVLAILKSGIQVEVARDSKSGFSDSCEKFIIDNWSNKG